jgi:competence protein ComEC
VGQGNSTLVRFPGGKNMLIDGGGFSDSSFDTGKSVLAPFLYHERISNVDTVVLSHPHPDHLLGLIYIMNNFNVRQAWRSNLPIDLEDYPGWEKAIKLTTLMYLWFPINSRKKYLTVSGLMSCGRQIILPKR